MGDDTDRTLFLLDGLAARPAPVLLLVTDRELAGEFARRVHSENGAWPDAPATRNRLLAVDPAAIAKQPEAAADTLLDHFAGTADWLFAPDIDQLTGSPAGRRVLAGLPDAVRAGAITAVLASTSADGLTRLRSAAPRLTAFAQTLESGRKYVTNVMVSPSTDPTDHGWTVLSRLDLTAERGPVSTATDRTTRASIELTEQIQMIERGGDNTAGVLIGFLADAFTMSQAEAALTTAAIVARHLVGRPLRPDEKVTAVRAIYHS
jgi:hypothetical protein